MSRRKPLPLESANWWPVVDALKHRTQRLRSALIARQDFNQALKAGRLRALLRRAGGHRELLDALAWNDFYIVLGIRFAPPDREPFLALPRPGIVSSRELGKPPRDHWFYVWEPDYKKIFDPVTTPAEPRTQPQEVPIKRGKKPIHDRADLQSAALGLALQRKQGAPEKKPTDVVDELREWCKRNKRKVPADSTLYDIVAAAFLVKPTLKS